MGTGELERNIRSGFIVRAALAIALICLLPAPAKAWLYYSVPPIQGTITDATTGQPIENAVLVVKWLKMVYGPFEPQTFVIKKLYVATDEKGVFRIPANTSIHIFSSFTSVMFDVRHPLHSTVQLGVSREGIDVLTQPDRKIANQTDILKHASLGASGEIVFNFTLLSLKEKFKDKPSVPDFRGELYQEFLHEGPKYFSMLKQLGLTVNVDTILKEWDEIAGRFIDVDYVQSALKLGKQKIAAGASEDYAP